MSSRFHSVAAAAALPIFLSLFLVVVLMACAVVAASAGPTGAAPSDGGQVPSSSRLTAVARGDPALERLATIHRHHQGEGTPAPARSRMTQIRIETEPIRWSAR